MEPLDVSSSKLSLNLEIRHITFLGWHEQMISIRTLAEVRGVDSQGRHCRSGPGGAQSDGGEFPLLAFWCRQAGGGRDAAGSWRRFGPRLGTNSTLSKDKQYCSFNCTKLCLLGEKKYFIREKTHVKSRRAHCVCLGLDQIWIRKEDGGRTGHVTLKGWRPIWTTVGDSWISSREVEGVGVLRIKKTEQKYI